MIGSMKRPTRWMQILTAVAATLASRAAVAEDAPRPNILFVLADDCTYRDTELYGGQGKTPNLNRLAQEGMKFNRCYQAAAICSPTRHNLYTGIYPVKTGAYPNHTFANSDVKSIVHHLKAAGYRVALAGKTHILPYSVFPFEYLNDFENSYEKKPEEDLPRTGPRYPLIEQFVAECVSNKTPFCLFAASHDPHGPFERGDQKYYSPDKISLPPDFVDTPKTRREFCKYLAEITFFDGQLGECLNILERNQLRDSTLVMVATEQGNAWPFAKWTCYENGVASGLVVRWPGKVAPGSTSDAIVEYCDVVPTMVEAANASLVAPVDGKSFLPVLLGKATQHKEYAYSLHTSIGVNGVKLPFAIRSCVSEQFRYIRNLNPENPFTCGGSHRWQKDSGKDPEGWKGEWKAAAKAGNEFARKQVERYIYHPDEELYDIKNDPYCLTNLADNPEFAEIKKTHAEKVDAWMAEQGDKGVETEEAAVMRNRKYAPKKKGAPVSQE